MAQTPLISLSGPISKICREDLTFNMKSLEPEVDAFFTRMVTSSAGVEKSTGRGFRSIETFAVGVAGAYKFVDAQHTTGPGATQVSPMIDVANTGQVLGWDTGGPTTNPNLRTFQGLNSQTDPGYVQKTVDLVQGMGAISFPLHFFMLEQGQAGSIAKPIELKMKGMARNILQVGANCLYANSNTTKATATALTGAVSGSKWTWTSNVLTIDLSGTTPLVQGRIGRFLPGMTFQYMRTVSSVPTVITGNTLCIVTKVDYLAKVVTLWCTDNGLASGATAPTSGVLDADYLVPAGSQVSGALSPTANVVFGPSGIERSLTDSGSPYGISLTSYPQLKSMVVALNGLFDEGAFNKYVGGFFDAYGGMCQLDSLLTTTGVLTALVESLDGLHRYERNNETMKMKMGWSTLTGVYAGQTFDVMTSRYQLPGQAYILKTGDQNWKRKVPPSIEGMTSQGEFEGYVQFLGKWFGSTDIFMPERAVGGTTGGALTEFKTAPFVTFEEWVPTQMQGIKLTGCSETNP